MKNIVMETQSKYYAIFTCILSALSANVIGIIYSLRIRGDTASTFEQWASSFPCNHVLYLLCMIYYIGIAITAASFNFVAMFYRSGLIHLAWAVPLSLLCIASFYSFYTAQYAYAKIYPESACLVQKSPSTEVNVRRYSGQVDVPGFGPQLGPSLSPLPTQHHAYPPPMVTQPAGLRYPLI
eukprot:TRINITY_DN6943_c0_g2_i4.p1 TRINITY_DN6943_c0_g2~~TRINITY_DN6943_c0_g2_i4.p1  ORF type:complete len:181 (-),score=24.02 TRINITY_DN6943_c0_g2_i4:155-697(-)